MKDFELLTQKNFIFILKSLIWNVQTSIIPRYQNYKKK